LLYIVSEDVDLTKSVSQQPADWSSSLNDVPAYYRVVCGPKQATKEQIVPTEARAKPNWKCKELFTVSNKPR